MRVLHVVPTYIPAYSYGGPIRSVHGLCKGLTGLGHEVHVFTTNVDQDKDSDVPIETPVDIDGVKVWYFPSKHLRRLYWSPSMRRALSHEIKNFDLVHIHSIFLWPTWAAARLARAAGVPYIIAPRGMLVKELIRRKSHFLKTAWIKLIEKKNLKAAAAIHVTSKTEADDVAQFGFGLKKVVIVPNGVDMPEGKHPDSDVSQHINSIIEKGPYLLFLGRVNWKKGLDRLIPALSYVPGVNLVVAGNDEENYLPKLEKLVTENGLDGRVIFCGPVYDADKEALFNNAKLFILPSYSENFGIAVLEAMAAGCPVVVTSEVGVAEIVRESGSGVVINGNSAELGKGIKDLLLDSKQLKEMGEQGMRAVANKYTWAVVAGQMGEVYKKIIMQNIMAPNA
jgi:glycosyltransferase involved in cell wall biosynthesis